MRFGAREIGLKCTRRLAIGLCAAHSACLKGDYDANHRTPF
jgi:hypothetical protein